MTVEIIGQAAATPGARNTDELFSLLIEQKCSVTEIPAERWDQARYWHPTPGTRGKTYTFAAGVLDDCFAFDPAVFSMSRPEAMLLDPQQRVILQLTWQALEDANIDFADLGDQRVGVYIGASSLDHGNLVVEDPAAAGPYFMTGNTLSIVSNRISHVFSLNGPSLTVDTACSSSLVALDLAMKALESGDIETAIVGGVNVLTHPLSFVGFAQARMLSPEGLCRAYDDNGAGYVRSEGGGILILRRSDVAKRCGDRSHARIVASGVNSAGRTNGISLPSGSAQLHLLRSIYREGGIDANDIAFIEGHGTGTKVGDPAEIFSIGMAIGKARRAPVPIGSIKSNIGHAEPASGVLGLIKAVLALKHNRLPATLHFETPNSAVDLDELNVHVAADPIDLLSGPRPRLAGINSFGFGGTNAHVVISDPQPAAAAAGKAAPAHTLMVSAHSRAALQDLVKSYAGVLAKASADERRAVVAASGANRHAMRHRFVATSSDAAVLARAAEEFAFAGETGLAEVAEVAVSETKMAFAFSGNGSQWAGMGVDAYRSNSAFRKRFDIIDALFEVQSGMHLNELLFDEDLGEKLADTRIAQPLLFAVQACLVDVLAEMGVRPAATFGHSVGEIAAAYAAGILSLVDAVAIVSKRSAHQHALAGTGGMAAANMTATAAREIFAELKLDDLCVAAENAPGSITVSGNTEQLSRFREHGRARHIPVHVLNIDYPFHHPLIERARAGFLDELDEPSLRASEIDFISSVTGGVLDGQALDAEYWWRNVRDPVLFRAACDVAADLGCGLFVEIGPRPILSGYVRDTLNARSLPVTALASMRRTEPGGAVDPVQMVFSRIVAHGGAVDRTKVFGQRRAEIVLPKLPVERESIHHDFTSDAIDLYGRSGRLHTLSGWRSDPAGSHWKNHVDANLYPDLAEHIVDGKAILPGSGFLEMAVSAARQYFGDGPVEISDLEIMRPLELARETMREISVVLSPETGDMTISSRERLTDDDWALHAVARARKLKSSRPASAVNGKRRAGAAAISGAHAYETARRFGLDYGPRFRLLKEALRIGEDKIDVTLEPPFEKGCNPFVSYSLHPISVDAVFHGLVAVFDSLSGDRDGAPFIPVRFGRLRLYEPGAGIGRATIVIRRHSETSIKVDFQLFSTAGSLVATIDDCRFKRTYLRRVRRLPEVSYHQELVPSLAGWKAQQVEVLANWSNSIFAGLPATSHDSSQELLEAAVFSACHDIARRLSGGSQSVSASEMPGDASLRNFLINCLYIAEDAGFASFEDGRWAVQPESSLPPAQDILAVFVRDRPDRAAEAVLVNHVLCETLMRIEASGSRPRSLERPDERTGEHCSPLVSEATLAHLREHSSAALERHDVLTGALCAALESVDGKPAFHVVEFLSSSIAATSDLAERVLVQGGRFTVVETFEPRRRALEARFAELPGVAVSGADDLKTIDSADLMISGSEDLHSSLRDDEGVAVAFERLLRAGAHLVLCPPAPSTITDFMMGLTEGWFEPGTGMEFPVGRVAAAADWETLLSEYGVRDARVEIRTGAHGDFVLAAGRGGTRALEASTAVHADIVVLHDAGLSRRQLPPGNASVRSVGLGEDPAAAAHAISKMLAEIGERPAKFVYVCSSDPDRSGVDRLERDVTHLGTVAQALAAGAATGNTEIALGVILPPASEPVEAMPGNAGLWTFLRVLRNEFPGLDVHGFDFSQMEFTTAAAVIDTACGLIKSNTRNREWVFDGASGTLQEVRVVAGALSPRAMSSVDFAAATVRQHVPSQIGSLSWETAQRPQPQPDEVLIAVEATGLNFRDVMWAMGVLPEEALEDGFAGATIGMECAGRVLAVGSDVESVVVGDAVMAIAASAFATHVCVPEFVVARLPEQIDARAGATLPVAFVTAYYSLVELARIQPGESVLIHGGAGGVGLAALQIAKAWGAQVIATAGTVEKRRYLTMLGADHVFDSRSLDFVADVLDVTGQEGVDVVLNSLFAEAMERSLSVVKPFGRFLELGKRDFYGDTKLGLRPFRRNISYFGIDADQLLSGRPQLSKRLFSEISKMFASGALAPLPYRSFRHDEITDAFRLMQASGHIGKIVVTPPVPGRDRVCVAAGSRVRADPSGIHLVVGGIGGFGLATAEWLVERGALRLALCSRRGLADDETKAALKRWAGMGVEASVYACDITDEAAVAALLSELRAVAPIRTVVHAAMVLDDALIANLTFERNRPVIETKALGAANLDRLTRADALDAFILFSSATTVVGNPGQSNYVAANGYLEGLARRRRREGLPALAIAFGAISDTGFLKRNADVGDVLSGRIGNTAMRAREALGFVDEYLRHDPGTPEAAVFALADVDWNAAGQLAIASSPLLEDVARSARGQSTAADGQTVDLHALVAGKSNEEGEQAIFDVVAGEIASVLKIPVSDISRSKVIRDIGLDSLMAMELGMNFRQRTGIDMPLSSVTQSTTVGDVANRLYVRITKHDQPAAGEDNEILERLAGSHAQEKGAREA